jgi:ABC-type antimicrobial peptide transport system permease subunit
LGMLMAENGLIGLIAGLIGVGVGVLATVILVLASQNPDELGDSLDMGTMGWLVVLSISVSVGAAMLSAWTAAAEKPMDVLRYE